MNLEQDENQLWPVGEGPAKSYCDEGDRLLILASFDADALSGDPELARIAKFASSLCGTKSAAISLVENERQVFLARAGIEETETPRSTSLCAHTMLDAGILEVLDATRDPRFADFALVRGDARLRYYAGAPLISVEGAPLGALCVIDDEPRDTPLSETQREGLIVLAEAVKRRLHGHRHELTKNLELATVANRLKFVLDSVPDIAWSAGPGLQFDYVNARFNAVTGREPPKTMDDWRHVVHPDDYDRALGEFNRAQENTAAFEIEMRLRGSDGSYRYMLSRAVPSSTDPQTVRWFGTMTDIDTAHRVSQQRELLAGELAHRIKNIFSVITGLIVLNARGDPQLAEFAKTLTSNIRALSRAQEFALRLDDQSEDKLKSLLEVLMAPYGVAGHSAVSITGDDVETGPKSATPLALIFHELATNSAKHGALSVEEGKVAITVSSGTENVSIRWEETGGPVTTIPEDEGFGSRLVKMAVENQLGGTITQDWKSEGLEVVIELAVDRLIN